MPDNASENNMFPFNEDYKVKNLNDDFFRLKIDRFPLGDLKYRGENKQASANKTQKTDILSKDPALLFMRAKPKKESVRPLVQAKIPKSQAKEKYAVKTKNILKILKIAQLKFLKSLVRYAATTTAIFVIGLIVLNFSAYTIVAKSWINKAVSQNKADTLSPMTHQKRKVEKPLPLAVINTPEKLKEDIPAFTIDPAYPDYRLIIPKINLNVPIVKTDAVNLHQKNWEALEKQILSDLQNGVVHYPGTAMPGETGNTVITGHSSYWPWDSGRYKTVFAPLHDVNVGDKLYIWSGQNKISYEVIERKVVSPETIEVMKQGEDKIATFVTCTPIGTTLKRLIIVAKVI